MNNPNNNDWQTGMAIKHQSEKNRIQTLELEYARATDPNAKRELAMLLERESNKQKKEHQTIIVVGLVIVLASIILGLGMLWYTGTLDKIISNMK